MLSGEAVNTHCIIFGFTRPGIELTIYCNWCENANSYSTEKKRWERSGTSRDEQFKWYSTTGL